MSLHYRTCNLCEAMCGLVIDHENGKIRSIKGDQDDPFSKVKSENVEQAGH